MLLTYKQQLIALSLAGLSLKKLWDYTEQLVAKDYIHDPLDIKEMETLLNHRYNLSFIQEKEEEIHSLSQKAITIGEPLFPKAWLHIPQPPLILYYEGNIELLQQAPISLIGSRKYTPYGEAISEVLVEHLTRYNFTIISGLAKGIDSIAHRRASQMKDGSTCAILPTAMDHYYPSENRELQQHLMRKHLVLSEYLPRTPVQKHHFIMRNRLVAGLSPACLIIEVAKRSGSLITANYALQFNKEVYALPGRISDPQSQGTNELIEAGAQPILSIPHIVTSLCELYLRQGYQL